MCIIKLGLISYFYSLWDKNECCNQNNFIYAPTDQNQVFQAAA